MRRQRDRIRAALCAAALLLAMPAEAAGQRIIQLAAGRGELGLGVRGFFTGSNNGIGSRTLTFRQWIAIPIKGMLFDPQLLSYSVTLRPTFRQDKSPQQIGTISSQQLDLDGSVRLFARMPVSLTLAGGRSTGSSRGGLGLISDFRFTTFDANLSWPNRVFPMRLSYSARSTSRIWAGSPVAPLTATVDRLRRTTLTGTSSKTRLSVEYVDFLNPLTGLSYEVVQGTVNHMIRWGKGSHLQSDVGYSRRRDGFVSSQIAWREDVHLQHTRRIGSSYNVRWVNSTTDLSKSRTLTYGINVNHRPTDWFGWGLRGSGVDGSFSGLRSRVRSLGSQASVSLPITNRIRLSGSASLGFENRRSDGSPTGSLAILDERHVIPLSRTFELNNPQVDLSTLTITNGDKTILYVDQFDYVAVPIGDLVQIRALPSGRIATGTAALASYRITFVGEQESESVLGSYSVMLNAGRFRIRQQQFARRTESVPAGATLAVPEFNDMFTHVGFVVPFTPAGPILLDLERRRRISKNFVSTRLEVRGTIILPQTSRIQSSVSLSWFQNTGTGLRFTGAVANAYAQWHATDRLNLRGVFRVQFLDDSNARMDRTFGGSLDLDWRFASLNLLARFSHEVRSYVDRTTVDRFSVEIRRRF